MKFQYLGTAAAEGWPGIFCTCDACRKAREAGGRNLRTRSQAMVDDRLLIDFPADTYAHVLAHGLDLEKVHDCLITHDHTDHFHPEDFEMRRTGFAYLREELPLTVYGTEPAERKLRAQSDMAAREKENRVLFRRVRPFETETIAGYRVTPLKADHDPRCDPVFYLIADGRHTLLYANDTGWFPEETWAWFERERPVMDFVSLDCTCILQPCRNNHMDLTTCIEVRERLRSIGCVSDATRCSLHHFSHNGRLIYDELVPVAHEHGFEVSYDGMTVELG